MDKDSKRGLGVDRGVNGGKQARGAARFWVLALLLITVNGLGWLWNGRRLASAQENARDSVRVLRVEPAGILNQASELTVVFDRPVASEDQLGETLEESPFALEPARDGRWRWTSPTELQFELAEPLPAGRRFHIQAQGDFEARTGLRLIGETGFERTTGGLQVTGTQLASCEQDAATFVVEFNGPVAPDDLTKALQLHARGKELRDWRVLNAEAVDSLRVHVALPPGIAGRELGMHISKGLLGVGAEIGLAADYRRTLPLPLGFVALSARAYPNSTENECSVSVRFSEVLALGQSTPTLTFEPAVECGEATIRGRELHVTGAFECGRTYKVQVGESLLSGQGSTLGSSSPLSFRVPKRSREVSMPEGSGTLMPTGSLQLGVRVTNLPAIEVTTTRLHANNLVAHVHGQSANTTSRRIETKRFELDLKPNVITDCVLPLEELVEDPLGVYQVTVSDPNSYWNRASSLVRVSDMALTVKNEAQGLFVWVTSLSGGEPLEGVALEARTANNQVLGRARSSADGTARLTYPDELPDGGAFVVSATLGRDFAYLRPDQRTWVFDSVDTSGKAYDRDVDA
ncbi:MAG: hypothetical protein KDB61_06150, partial [Planctomycetes bacterium]|nr:hypothetical protein [Planctomycetota bacterium]